MYARICLTIQYKYIYTVSPAASWGTLGKRSDSNSVADSNSNIVALIYTVQCTVYTTDGND